MKRRRTNWDQNRIPRMMCPWKHVAYHRYFGQVEASYVKPSSRVNYGWLLFLSKTSLKGNNSKY